MHIDGDALKRKWIELAGTNPAEVGKYRPALVGFLAFSRSGLPAFSGTGFVIAGGVEGALVITAKHVLQEGVLRTQKPESATHSTNPFVTARSITPSIDPRKLRATWLGGTGGEMLKVIYVQYNDVLDIAVCWLVPEDESKSFTPSSVPLDIAVPQVGETVHMVSLDRLKCHELRPPSLPNGGDQMLKMETRVSIRVGKVTGVHQFGLRQYAWPCFTTSIPAEPGMSGGLVTIPRHNQTVGACGIICADNSSKVARKNQRKAGDSIIASAWPSLGLKVPTMSQDDAPKLSLYEMMRIGNISKAQGDLTRIILDEQGNNDWTIQLNL